MTNEFGEERHSSSLRVLRGGGFRLDARYCRSARRYGYSPGLRGCDLGFRPVITIGLSYGFTVKADANRLRDD